MELEDNGGHTVYYHSIEDEEHQTDRQRVIRSHNILGHWYDWYEILICVNKCLEKRSREGGKFPKQSIGVGDSETVC